ncbi:glutamate synthase-related protein, partial [Calditrichota bacterium]
EIVTHSYTSIISPFPFHNCYSIEDVKAFIDIVRMINPSAVISVKVSPSVDIEFIATGLARIAKDNTEEALKMAKRNEENFDESEIIQKYGMTIEVWLDGPRGGTGASPNIIKGQMGMHIEYAIPLIHNRLVKDGLRNHIKFMVSGGIRTYEDVIKAVALGADGVIWGTAPLVAIGCDRNRNCHDGCSRGIATSNLIMQKLRDVELNSKQIINAFLMMQMQVIRALAGLGFNDIRELRGRYDKIQWLGLKERVDFRIRQRMEFLESEKEAEELKQEPIQSNCGVAAIIGTEKIPSYILDRVLYSMKNRGMDGVGVGKTLCFPEYPNHYSFRVMVKGILQNEMEEKLNKQYNNEILQSEARKEVLAYRIKLVEQIYKVFLKPYFIFAEDINFEKIREKYKKDESGIERDYREFGNENTDPGDIFRFFVRVNDNILKSFIENMIFSASRYAYIREYFKDVNLKNYQKNTQFMNKAEDLFVFDHSVLISQSLYVWQADPEFWGNFISEDSKNSKNIKYLDDRIALSLTNIDKYGELYLNLVCKYFSKYRPKEYSEIFKTRIRKIATVMSAGKNFAVWKTAGREIPWETPPSSNNIIHVRLATGSIVEQMNAHPFAKLHTALTHNGETTNYETLKQRVEQFGLSPLATTDTEVASLKFHLVAEELDYPNWALFESFSPTTGDDLALIPSDLRKQLEEIQRVEFTSSPDGPYQYLCLRHIPEKNITERIDLKDPADLRPSTTAFWSNKNNGNQRAFSIIASEEQAVQRMLDLLDQEGIIDGAAADDTIVSNGMISSFQFDQTGKIIDYNYIDRYGQKMEFEDAGIHYSIKRSSLIDPPKKNELIDQLKENSINLKHCISNNLEKWDFNTYRWVLEWIKSNTISENVVESLDLFSYFIDYIRTFNTGNKAKSSLLDITRKILYDLLDQLPVMSPDQYIKIDFKSNVILVTEKIQKQTLIINAEGFEPEGTNPRYSLASLLAEAFKKGWRNYIIYKVNGQRLISTAVMGKSDTDDVTIDIYGTPGEYLGAFMQGGTIRVHGNSQNFTAMCMHHGNLFVFGNAGKVCGYASKGGKVFILGDINDRAWTNSVNDSRCQNLQIQVLGSASKYAGESLMGGDFFFAGLYFDKSGELKTQVRPYRGTKLLGGASRGRMLFFDPNNKLDPHQYVHGKINEINDDEWNYWEKMIEDTFELAGVNLKNGGRYKNFIIDGKSYNISQENFKLIVAKGGLKGYESH